MEDKYYTESHKKAIDRYDKDFNNTEKNVHNTTDTTVYYYAGNTTNNWVKFAGYYWRIIRTNADGSITITYY